MLSNWSVFVGKLKNSNKFCCLKLQNGEFNSLEIEDPHTLQLSWLEGWYAYSVAQKIFVHGYHGQGGQAPVAS